MDSQDRPQAQPGGGPYVSLLRDSQIPHYFDVELNRMEELKKYHSVELHVVLYPYSRLINSENYSIAPFEEYARDISGHLRSSYVAIHSAAPNIFGLALGALIATIFYHLNPEKLVSVESTVSILGAYAIGKELYDDLQSALIRLTKDWPARYMGGYYAYRMERGATMTAYSALARERRYGKQSLMPELFDFIEKSNSVTARMFFSAEDIAKFHGGESAHILSVHIDEELIGEFTGKGFMFGIKLTLNEKTAGILKSREMFQSIEGGRRGCLAMGTRWMEGAVCVRTAYSLGRVKYFASGGVEENQVIVEARMG